LVRPRPAVAESVAAEAKAPRRHQRGAGTPGARISPGFRTKLDGCAGKREALDDLPPQDRDLASPGAPPATYDKSAWSARWAAWRRWSARSTHLEGKVEVFDHGRAPNLADEDRGRLQIDHAVDEEIGGA